MAVGRRLLGQVRVFGGSDAVREWLETQGFREPDPGREVWTHPDGRIAEVGSDHRAARATVAVYGPREEDPRL